MLTNSTIARPLLALAAALLAAPLAAQDSTTVTGERHKLYQERVSYSDLDLNRTGQQRELRNRVRDASHRVCVRADGPNTDSNPIPYGMPDGGRTCADLTYDDARPSIAAAIRAAKSGQPQLATALVIAAPARAR
jgi:UrcA family protein